MRPFFYQQHQVFAKDRHLAGLGNDEKSVFAKDSTEAPHAQKH